MSPPGAKGPWAAVLGTNCAAYCTGATIVAESTMETGRPWDGERGWELVRVPQHIHTHTHTRTHMKRAKENGSGIWYRGLECDLECRCVAELGQDLLGCSESLTNTVTV